jgi:hypothetical protein
VVNTGPANSSDQEQAEQIARQDQADLDNALAVLRERVDQEFRRTERLDAKSRQAFALAAGFFALTQAVAFASFGESAVSSDERAWILVAAVAAVAALTFTAICVYHAEKLRDEGSVPIQSVFDWCLEQKGERLVTAWLILAHRQVASERKSSNADRAKQAKAVASAAALTLTLCATELILALAVRM